ncbi:MAG: LysM peptidoglycan-binding domain-containing protein [Candidatus Limnocylindrales bacterium]
MHDRPAAGADGLLACPFLALAGDRDMRIDVPDRRHRCYAEPEPAPRAIAHQHEYCLSASFAACPTFQDWARREAARVIGVDAVVGRSDYVPPREVGSEPTIWGDGRAWAAPPPWLAGEVDDATSSSWEPGQGTAGSGEEYAGSAGADAGTLEPTLAAAPVAPARTAPVPAAPPAGTLRASSTDDVDLPTFLAGRHGPVALERAGARGARPGGPSEGQDGPREARGTRTDRVPPARPSPDLRPDGTPRPGRAARVETASSLGGEDAGAHAPPGGLGRAVPLPRRVPAALAGDGGPDWERPRRREAYPSLHMPLGLPHVPRVWLGVVAVLVAALVLFLAPTLLPGLFGAQPLATPASAPSVAPSVSIAPTPPPLPTPFVYTVVEGDTLSGIATRYGLTVPELMKANPQIKNENKLGIGDRLTIPVSGASSGGSGVTPAPSGLAAP